MTAISIGWFGTGPLQQNVAEISTDSDGIEVTGRLSFDGGDTLAVLASQLVDLADQPRVAQPVTIDSRPDLNGWYYVDSASFDAPKGSVVIGWWPYKVRLRRAGGPTPLFESRLLGLLRANSIGRSQPVGWHAVPDGATGYGGPANLAAPTTRQAEGGPVRVYTAGNNGLLNEIAKYRVPAAGALVGACSVSAGSVDSAPSAGFGYVGPTVQSYTVPAGVTRLRADVRGASALVYGQPIGGRGARVTCELLVIPGETLTVYVAGQGGRVAGGWPGGGAGGGAGAADRFGFGGGGYSALTRTGGGFNILAIAGGGGGSGGRANGSYFYAGDGGSNGGGGQGPRGGTGAGGGTQTAGGAAGTSAGSSTAPATAGIAGVGGQGGSTAGAWGGGGGGAGWYGGGGNGSENSTLASPGGSGGGGSSFGSGSLQTLSAGYQAGDGEVLLTPIYPTLAVERHRLTGLSVDSAPFGWQIDNGILRVTPVYRGDSLMLDFEAWTGTAWGPARRWMLTDSGATMAATLVGVSVARNTPEMCVVVLDVESGARSVRSTVTVSLRRGSPIADVNLSSSASKLWGWLTESASPGTLVGGGGVVATTADSAGSKWLTVATQTTAALTSAYSGYYLTSPSAVYLAGIGFVPNGWSETPFTLVSQWFAAVAESVRAVRG